MRTIIKNAKIVTCNEILSGYVCSFCDGIIDYIGKEGACILEADVVIDAQDKYVLPGFIDTHIHGAYGARISDKNVDLNQITGFEATQGVTGLAITTAASEFTHLLKQIDCAVEAAEHAKGAKILGIHAEGPFINPKRRGAMNADYILKPDTERMDQMLDHGKGLLKLMTVAPEMPGVLELIPYAAERGVTVSLGHTDATFEEAMAGIESGASQSTHTFNAMRAYNHREPGILGAALLSSEVTCEMICDYVHLHPAACEMIYRLKGADHIRMISDSGHAAGMKVEQFEVDGLVRYVKDGVVRLADGTIAGSAKTLLDGVKNLLNSGVPMSDVVKMASYNPAKCLKLEQQTGSLEVGKCADLVVLNSDYEVEYTFVNGACAYKKECVNN